MELTASLNHQQHIMKNHNILDNVSKTLIKTLTSKKISYYHNNNIQSKWTPIEHIIKDIRVDKTQSFIITKI
jgi:hypothetical protein